VRLITPKSIFIEIFYQRFKKNFIYSILKSLNGKLTITKYTIQDIYNEVFLNIMALPKIVKRKMIMLITLASEYVYL